MPKSKVRAKRRKALKRKESASRYGGGEWRMTFPEPVFGNDDYDVQVDIVCDVLSEELCSYYGSGGSRDEARSAMAFLVRGPVVSWFPEGSFFDENAFKGMCVALFIGHIDGLLLPESFDEFARVSVVRVWENLVERCAAAGVPVV